MFDTDDGAVRRERREPISHVCPPHTSSSNRDAGVANEFANVRDRRIRSRSSCA
jgi:hypothetical protein